MAKSAKTQFGCKECGDVFAKWFGKCPSCGAMNSIDELNKREAELLKKESGKQGGTALKTVTLNLEERLEVKRIDSGIAEVNRVLGGGFPIGAVILIGGEPGIGKSTLLAQCCGAMGRKKDVLYVTAEESVSQVRERFHRLDCASGKVHLASSTDCDEICTSILSKQYQLAVIDSIQLVTHADVDGLPGSVSQVRSCTAKLVEAAKHSGCTLVLVGHVTKDGNLAGPRLLEHLVDTVVNFEGDRYQELRTLRSVKNRFGSTNELGLFTMGNRGLEEVPDASGLFIKDRDANLPGSCIVPALEGNRCVLVEIQALVNNSDYPQPVRRVSGLDNNRVQMIIAVLSRRLKYKLGNADIFVNVTGGARVYEPSADLGIALAIASAYGDFTIPSDLAAIGEIGLGGELRPATRYEARSFEARRLGFKQLLGPGPGKGRGRLVASNLLDAIKSIS